ncbi:MAG: PLP-dependent transferase [Pseudomonadota bacterium]
MTQNSKGSLIRPDTSPQTASHPVVTPLSPAVVYASDTPDMLDAQYDGDLSGYTYSREGHPNADVVAARIDRMEDAQHLGVMCASGMAAVSAVLLGLTESGDHVLGGNQLYGRSLRLMKEDLPRLGIATSMADPTDADAFIAAMRANTKIVLLEAVSNPTLRVADLIPIIAAAKDRGILVAVDNTFTTPRALKPYELGADIVIHSVTKLLAGHSDVLLGYVSAKDPALLGKMRVFTVTTGMVPSPFDCWLAERGMLSFDIRFDRTQSTAAQVAEHLSTLPGVARVIYPQRSDHPDYAVAQSLLGAQGCNMVSFEVAPSRAAANALARAAEGIQFAPTLGDVGTTLSHPASSSHRALTPAQRAELGISEGFFRVSVGLEDAEVLCQVFTSAVAAAQDAS